MSVLIKGMEMPKEGFVEILIRDDGTVQQTGQSFRIDSTDYYTPYVGEMPKMFTAVHVPPHGRLIDADALLKEHYEGTEDGEYIKSAGVITPLLVSKLPTIIPAEEET